MVTIGHAFSGELRRIRRVSLQDRLAWGFATLLACIALLLVALELIGAL